MLVTGQNPAPPHPQFLILQACSGARGFAFLTSSHVMPWCWPGTTPGKHAVMQHASPPHSRAHTCSPCVWNLLPLHLSPVPSYPALINTSSASLSLYMETGCLFLDPHCVSMSHYAVTACYLSSCPPSAHSDPWDKLCLAHSPLYSQSGAHEQPVTAQMTSNSSKWSQKPRLSFP